RVRVAAWKEASQAQGGVRVEDLLVNGHREERSQTLEDAEHRPHPVAGGAPFPYEVAHRRPRDVLQRGLRAERRDDVIAEIALVRLARAVLDAPARQLEEALSIGSDCARRPHRLALSPSPGTRTPFAAWIRSMRSTRCRTASRMKTGTVSPSERPH